MITERLKSALSNEKEANAEQEATTIQEEQKEPEAKIVTTVEEMESFLIVKNILRQKVDINRIFYRDAQSYFAILLDNNNRKTICRLYLDGNKKYFVVLDENKKEARTEITTLDDLFNFTDKLFEVVENYDNNNK